MEGKAYCSRRSATDGWPVPLDFCRLNGKSYGRTEIFERVIDTTARWPACTAGSISRISPRPPVLKSNGVLDEMLDIPVFHDDQWGTAVITLAGVFNYRRLADRKMADLSIRINGAGAKPASVSPTC